jgi:hypothetical protein
MNKLSLICAIILSSICMRTYAASNPETVIMPDAATIRKNLDRTRYLEQTGATHLVDLLANQRLTHHAITIMVNDALRNHLYEPQMDSNRQITVEPRSENSRSFYLNLAQEFSLHLWLLGDRVTYPRG